MGNLKPKREYGKNEYEENPEPKRESEKTDMRKILNQIENMKKQI